MASFSLENMNDAVLQVLECPICLNYMAAPILLCKNGHHICSSCKTKQENCPTCREEFSAVRSLALEQLSEVAYFPCENKEAGCEVKMLMVDGRKHFPRCPYRLYECIAGNEGPCGWKGRSTQLLEHVSQVHPKYAWMKDVNRCTWMMENETYFSHNIVQAHGELFWRLAKVDVEKRKIYFAIQYIGRDEKCKEFVYEYKFEKAGCPESIFFRLPTHKDTDSIDDIFKSGRCVSLDLEFTDVFSKDGKFCYEFGVQKFKPSCLLQDVL